MPFHGRKGLGWSDRLSERVRRSISQPPHRMQETSESSKPREYPPEIKQSLEVVQKFIANCMAKKCHFCSSILTEKFSARDWIRRWGKHATGHPENAAYLCAASCPNCEVLTCLGCGHRPKRNNQPQQIDGRFLDWCCREGRLFGMWALLARFDETELRIQAESSSNSEDPMLKRRLSRKGRTGTQDSRGIGYADRGDFSPWVNAFYDGSGGHQPALSRPLEFHSSDLKTDKLLTSTLSVVREMVPSLASTNLPPELRGMFQLSILIDKVAELLRNDSLEDITSRTEVYMAASQFVKKLGAHPELVTIVQASRHHKQRTPGLESLTLRPSKSKKGKNQQLVLGDSIPSVAERLHKLAIQSGIVLSLRQNEDLTSRAGQEMLYICKEISEVYEIIAPRKTQHIADGQLADRYQAYHQAYCVIRDERILTDGHTFNSHATRMIHSPPGRMKRLLTEIANMATSLPVGIFVKVSDSRPDMMRCLIMGPPDSPYGYGLFDFDLLCKETYPQQPPLMACRTALECRESLNPNLHRDGKVCLSLLGTWREGDAAAQWQPGKSTILSVLISIQAMIFTEDPFRNEPENTDKLGARADREAQMTIHRVQPRTIEYGMLAWLEQSQKINGVWGDIAKAHFIFNSAKILANVEKWIRGNPLIEERESLHRGESRFTRLKRALDRINTR